MASPGGVQTHRGRPPCLPKEEQERARASYAEQVSQAAPHLVPEAQLLLARLSPERWALEWSLPYWLGQSVGLPRGAWYGLVVSNLLGLGLVRLLDDLIDDDVPAKDSPRGAKILLASTLQHLWTGSLRGLLGTDPAFWSWFDLCLAQWQAATWESMRDASGPQRRITEADYARLGQRGAPLKVCVAAACLLAGRPERIAPVACAVDNLLTGAVLLDHALDWEEDLGRGTPNAFVSHVLAASPHGAAGPSRRAVSAALLAAEGAAPYFTTTRTFLATAAEQAEGAGVPRLADFARWVDALAAGLDSTLRRRVRETYAAASAQLRMAEGADRGRP